MKLNQRFSLVVFAFALVPIVLLSWVLFANMQEMLIRDKINEIMKNLALIEAKMEKTAELCNMTRYVFLNDAKLKSFLIDAKNGKSPTAEELIEFRIEGIGNLEKIINANPYLYQVRVYHENESLPEIMPILYHAGRMKRLSWAREPWDSGTWQLGYADRIFPEEVMQPTSNIMSLVTEIEDYEHGTLGVLEVAVRMDDVLPDLYAYSDGERAAFLKRNGGAWYSRNAFNDFWAENADRVTFPLHQDIESRAFKSASGESVILSSVYLSALDGW